MCIIILIFKAAIFSQLSIYNKIITLSNNIPCFKVVSEDENVEY